MVFGFRGHSLSSLAGCLARTIQLDANPALAQKFLDFLTVEESPLLSSPSIPPTLLWLHALLSHTHWHLPF